MMRLIVNADDFGYSKVFNGKILDLLEGGAIKSTTVMIDRVTEEAQEDQLRRLIALNEAGRIGIGLHVVFDLGKPLPRQAEEQFGRFRRIFKFEPSHIDLHKFLQNPDCVKTVYGLGKKHHLPVRNMGLEPPTKHTAHPVFNTTPLDVRKAMEFLDEMKDGETAEILCHPGEYDPDCTSSLNKEREQDYAGILKLQEYLKRRPSIKNINYKEL